MGLSAVCELIEYKKKAHTGKCTKARAHALPHTATMKCTSTRCLPYREIVYVTAKVNGNGQHGKEQCTEILHTTVVKKNVPPHLCLPVANAHAHLGNSPFLPILSGLARRNSYLGLCFAFESKPDTMNDGRSVHAAVKVHQFAVRARSHTHTHTQRTITSNCSHRR